MATTKSLVGLQKALRLHVGDGEDVTAFPAQDPQGYGYLLGRSRDQHILEDRQAADATPDPINPAQANYFTAFNRGREDGAMGPAGYNRGWAKFFEAPRVIAENAGLRSRLDPSGMDVSTESYGQPNAEGTLQPMTTPAQQLARLSGGPAKPLPESHEKFMARMAQKYGQR